MIMIDKHSALGNIQWNLLSVCNELIFLSIRHSEENCANLFATSDRGLLKTCKSEPQIEKIITLSELLWGSKLNPAEAAMRGEQEHEWIPVGMIGMLARPRAWSRVLVNKVICQNKADPLYSLMWLKQREREGRNVWEQSDLADNSRR